MRPQIMHVLVILLVVYVLFALLLWWREPRMIYYPVRDIVQTPADLGWKFEDIWLTDADGTKINGWYVPASTKPAADPSVAQSIILYFHGNAGNVSDRLDKLAILRSLGLDAFIIDYRGYGRSEGAPNEPGTYQDARAAYEWLTQQRHIDPRRIILYGESLGSAIAVDLATTHPVAGVILEEPFASVAAVGQKMFPFMPVRLLVRNKYDTLAKIAAINAPLLLFHSPQDELIPFSQGQQLYTAARAPKTFIELQGPHNEACFTSETIYRTALKDFWDRLSSPRTIEGN